MLMGVSAVVTRGALIPSHVATHAVGICGLCYLSVKEIGAKVERYRDIDLQFAGSREDTLLQVRVFVGGRRVTWGMHGEGGGATLATQARQ
jgi:hypothetical protein